MKFIIEDIGDRFQELRESISNKGIWFKEVKHIPFSFTWDISLPDTNYSSYFPFCSVNTMLLAKKIGMNVFFTESNYDYIRFAKEYGDEFINHDLKIFKFGDLPLIEYNSTDLNKTIYIRDAYGDNLVKGRVHSHMELTAKYSEYYGRSMGSKIIDDNYIMVCASPKYIAKEYRFFVIKGELITGSMYNSDGEFYIKNIDNDREYDRHRLFVNKMIQKYSPDSCFVIDICELEDKSLKVVECNCINCSGFYAIDIEKLIDKLLN